MIYGSVCSGIEAASVAWEPLGWRPAFFSEIEAAPRAVLAHHFPGVPLHGDFTTIRAGDYADIDVLVGGTPCQDFSVAGQRGGLDGERGGLTLAYADLAYELGPGWLVWENVPGVFSNNEGRDFGAVLACFAGHPAGTLFQPPRDGWRNAGVVPPAGPECYGLAWRTLDAQFVRVDGFPRAVPQRRRRVFVVGYLGDWRPAAAVLLERAGLSGDPAPRRETGEGAARPLASCAPGGSGYRNDADTADNLIAFAAKDSSVNASVGVSPTMQAADGRGHGAGLAVACLNGHGEYGGDVPTLRAKGGDAAGGSEALLAFGGNDTRGPVEVAAALNAHGGPAGRMDFESETFIAFDARQRDVCIYGNHAAPLDTDAFSQAIAFHKNESFAGTGGISVEHAPTMKAGAGGGSTIPAIARGWAVRRLLPVECERLQGFPDGWTDVPAPGRNSSLADGPRYKALGNSMAVPVMRWIGQRIAHVDALLSSRSFLEAAE